MPMREPLGPHRRHCRTCGVGRPQPFSPQELNQVTHPLKRRISATEPWPESHNKFLDLFGFPSKWNFRGSSRERLFSMSAGEKNPPAHHRRTYWTPPSIFLGINPRKTFGELGRRLNPPQWLCHAGEESRDQDEPSGPEMENYFFSTIASDLNTCSSGLMPSSLDDITAMILWSLPTTKVTRSMKP